MEMNTSYLCFSYLLSYVRFVATVFPPVAFPGHARDILVQSEPSKGLPPLRLLWQEVLPTPTPPVPPEANARR